MRFPSFKRLTKSDYDEKYSDLVESLGFSINNGIEPILEGLNKKLSIKDNFLGTTKDVDLVVDSSGNVISGGILVNDFRGSTIGVTIIKADNLTNSSIYPTAAPWASWNSTTTGIQIYNVSGLQAQNRYRLRILTLGE